MKGRALGLGVIAPSKIRPGSDGIAPGNGAGNGPSGQRSRATFSLRIAAKSLLLTTQTARLYGNRMLLSGLSRRRSRVRVPSLP